MIDVQRAADRFRTAAPGIVSWHSFSSGPHYDPENLSFGPIVACDEHLIDPSAGFDRHPHARIELVTWVLEGALWHEDATGRTRMIAPGRAQYQLAGTGIEHSERNASDYAPLHFVQFWLLTDEDVPDYDVAAPPLNLAEGRFSVRRTCRDDVLEAPGMYLFVGGGHFDVNGQELAPGDSVRARSARLRVSGDGELLVIEFKA